MTGDAAHDSTHHDEHHRAERRRLVNARVVVVKVGSAVLAPGGVIDPQAFQRLSADLASLRSKGRDVVLVSSGAIAAGFRPMGYPAPPPTVNRKQAAASVGQPLLMALYRDVFAKHGITTAQILLTAGDIEDRTRAVNARHTLVELLRAGVLPIVNENDTVAHDEIRFGDNDRLSALVAQLVGADALVILSVADALREHHGAGKPIHFVPDIDRVERHVGVGVSSVGTGGMASKLAAARIATRCGTAVLITDGRADNAATDALSQNIVGTLIPPLHSRGARWGWIAHAARSAGSVAVDPGARDAILDRGASLLPVGIVRVDGEFERGDVVSVVCDVSGSIIARGVAEYAATDTRAIAGLNAADIESRLGSRFADEFIHRDSLTVLHARDPETAPPDNTP